MQEVERDTEKTVVVFRKWRDSGDIIALFPHEVADLSGNCLSYMTIGQHGAADYEHCIAATTPATPDEYCELEIELENFVGYRLDVRKRRPSYSSKGRQAFTAKLQEMRAMR